ncbi:Phenazine biosynthesis protein PhzF like [Devosia sp. H5989]|nr:Phenazine biosynthesis protein PhzF like [Devosia sp. H5989]
MRLNYQILDVFTDRAFAGNPLAVVMDADGLSGEQMQAIAREFNLSETIFLSAPADGAHMASARIFTVGGELPFAGHPTVGGSVALGLRHQAERVTIEEKVGLIVADVALASQTLGHAEFDLPRLPAVAGEAAGIERTAAALGLLPEDIGCEGFAPAVWSAGVEHYLVPVRDAQALARIRLDANGWAETFPIGRHFVFAFTATPEEPENDYAARMLSALIGEDPATGSAAASLTGALAERIGFDDGEARLRIRQGHEMGRPSLIEVYLRKAGGRLVQGRVGGEAVLIAEGVLHWDEPFR